jgi:hypothetical protein
MPGAAYTSPTPAQLRERAERLLYEVLMLSNTAALLDEHTGASDGWKELTSYMAVVESFLLHTHSLLGFLYPPKRVLRKNKRKPDEVYALDYCGASWRARPWAHIDRVRATIRQDALHLSLARLPVTRSDEYARVLVALRRSLSSFLDDADRLSVSSRSRLRAALEESGGGGGRRHDDAAHPSARIPAIPVPSRFLGTESRS